MRTLIWMLVLGFIALNPGRVSAEVEVVMTNSDPVVAVHSNFRGQAVTLFGTVETPPPEGQSYSVVVVVQGPSSDWVVREKTRQFGLVLNAQSATYERVPSYYGIFSSSPLEQLGLSGLSVFDPTALAKSLREDVFAPDFDGELVRLMQARGRFSVSDRGVVMLSSTAFSVRVPIASNATNGLYLARAFVYAGGERVADSTTRFTVRTQGFERYVADVARSNPPLYGLVTILIALGTGWLGGVLFRR
ncbi:conserved hypothetical protein [Devosia lucknowensis]|uniref:Transmembrane protein (Alph_Pro_TM) n=1 Tax=Devosia lucknowensis TaxID=1096929 RepID=A0A1Y6G5G5_9HYPH|nr:TIGR02186 family protein [Devosia lucknowensis]SMQ85422.1 conserved hypothetical protein [Devosia lucknowensis]